MTAKGKLAFRNGPYTYSIAREGSQIVYSISDGKNSITKPILYCFGQGHVGQTFLFRHNDMLYETRVSYFEKVRGLDFTIVSRRSSIPAASVGTSCRSRFAARVTRVSNRRCPVSTNKCATCHMPKIELPGMHAEFTDHWIRNVKPGEPTPR